MYVVFFYILKSCLLRSTIDFYAAINFGSTGAISAAFLARDNGYWSAYLVPTCIFVLVPFVLLAGKKNYIMTPPRGSILLEVGGRLLVYLYAITINSSDYACHWLRNGPSLVN